MPLTQIQELMHGLGSSIAAVRTRSARELGKFGLAAKDAFPLLLKAANDPEQSVREAAVHALTSFGGTAVPYLIEFLQHHDKYVRRNAVWALSKLGPAGQAALAHLCEALKDEDPRTASGAAQALGALGELGASAVPALAEAMRGTNVVLCRLAAKALSQIGPPALTTLIAHLKHHDPFVRGEAAVALGWMGPGAEEAVPHLMELLQSGRPLRPRETRGASNYGSGTITPLVEKSIQAELTPLESARAMAALALGRIGPAALAALPMLIAVCDDPCEQVRTNAEIAVRCLQQA